MQRNSYLSAQRKASQTFHNAGGLINSPDRRGLRPRNWSANGGANQFPASDPIIINVSNASASNVANYDVFGAGQYLNGGYGGGTWSNAGNFTLNGVTISSAMPAVTYQQILNTTIYQPFTAGQIYLESFSGSTNQVTDIYTLTSVDNNGQQYTKPIKPYKDAYQFQNGITVNNVSFNMGALTKLTWNTIYSSAVFQVSIWPAQVVDPGAVLNGQNPAGAFRKPSVISNLR